MTESTFVEIDGIKTHYLEAGRGSAVVLLHGGEPGACGELSWSEQIDVLARHFRVIAPDWLGFGKTDKLFDFEQPQARRIRHMARFLAETKLHGAHLVGNSMGAGFLLQTIANQPELFHAKSMTLISGGGAIADGEARRRLVTYDGGRESMRAILAALFHDQKWAANEAYIDRRHRVSTGPGAWEVSAAMTLKSPAGPKSPPAPVVPINYAQISIPSMLIAGANDPLRKPDYAPEIAALIPGCELHVFDSCGHFPQIERAADVARLLVDFIGRAERAS